ncbi:ferredoxin/adrenodoxin [Anaeramoeba flamelloides]|uniref:Ferredoxin/adrenodoxin n=1 Tax=Anaeramoeba flamelloides TaxID=1746091 RepID=A0AAV8A849_9EUKA|nr:ferredoxin/adrenodoxin [Anaeramoeba flamelloides]|eukprot:Anaeramoba_flamelloidesa580_131.p1 GENE.a580_131~~a580_131.p1  ORF type:complete len:165 (+),score=30.02 a580_131:45-497(+)
MSLSLISIPKTLKVGSQLLTNTLFRNFSKANKKQITLIFEDEKGNQSKAVGKVGSTVLDIARSNKIRLHGACEGSSKCGTCHVYIKDPKFFDLFEEPSNTEFDVLDEVFQPRINSRLSCNLVVNEKMDQMVVQLPKYTRNTAVDGYFEDH